MKKTVYVLFFILITVARIGHVYAQNSEGNNLWNIVLPSPTAYSFSNPLGGNYVDLYTGRSNFSIPLFNLKGRSLSIPVNLNYSSSGVKVDESSSWVGNGWTLTAGGALSRAVIGLPDESPYGYWRYCNSFPTDGTAGSLDTIDILKASNGVIDFEPDVFSFNAGNLAGSFVAKKSADSLYTFFQIPNSDARIELMGHDLWRITDEQGIKYYFGKIDSTLDGVEECFTDGGRWNSGDGVYPTSWQLVRIVSANDQDTILFRYSTFVEEPYSHEVETQSYPASSQGSACKASFSKSSNTNTYYTKKLKQVETSQYIIDFVLSSVPRKEFSSIPLSYPLSKIQIRQKNKPGTPIVEEYDFATEDVCGALCNINKSTSYRLFLNELRKKSINGGEDMVYKFYYNNLDQLPSKESFGIDNWGYYNGVESNNTLIPYNLLEGNTIVGDADRNAYAQYAGLGMLSKVVFPTGGVLDYAYEANTFSHIKDTQVKNPVLSHKSNSCTAPERDGVSEQPFTVSMDNTTLFIDCKIVSDQCPLGGDFDPEVSIVDDRGNILYTKNINGQYSDVLNVKKAGEYKLRAQSNNCSTDNTPSNMAHIGVNYDDAVFQNGHQLFSWKEVGGGSRVKSISFSENGVERYYKSFSYDENDSVSSGLIQNMLNYSYQTFPPSGAGFPNPNCVMFNFTSGSVTGTSHGSFVTYDKVVESNGRDSSGGYIYHTFYNSCNGSSSFFPYPPQVSNDWRNGMPQSILTFRKDGVLLEKEEDRFNLNVAVNDVNYNMVYGLKIANLSNAPYYDVPNYYYHLLDFKFVPYSYISADKFLVQKRDVKYFGRDSLVSIEQYRYAPEHHHQVVEHEISTSNEKFLLSRNMYPQDYLPGSEGTMSEVLAALRATNQHPVIQATGWEKSKSGEEFLRTGSIDTYRIVGGYPYLDRLYSAEIKNGYVSSMLSGIVNNQFFFDTTLFKERVFIRNYTSQGNIAEAVPHGGAILSYRWNISGDWVLAKAVNAATGTWLVYSFDDSGFGGVWQEGAALTAIPEDTLIRSCQLPGGAYSHADWTVPASGLKPSTRYVVEAIGKVEGNLRDAGLRVSINGAGSSVLFSNEGGWQTVRLEVSTGAQPADLQVSVRNSVDATATNSGALYVLGYRVYPADAQVTSYTWGAGGGVTSQTDPSGQVTYYLYDGLGRLALVKDGAGHVLKCYSYHFVGLPPVEAK